MCQRARSRARLIPARELKTLPSRLPEALAQVLFDLAVPAESIARELAEMSAARFAKTASRSLLGTMNDYALPVTWALAKEPGLSLHLISDQSASRRISLSNKGL